MKTLKITISDDEFEKFGFLTEEGITWDELKQIFLTQSALPEIENHNQLKQAMLLQSKRFFLQQIKKENGNS